MNVVEQRVLGELISAGFPVNRGNPERHYLAHKFRSKVITSVIQYEGPAETGAHANFQFVPLSNWLKNCRTPMEQIGLDTTRKQKTLAQKLKHEIMAVFSAALYFACWLAILLLIKQLILAEYQIQFSNMSMALIGALILAKVVLVLEHVPLGTWLRKRPAWMEVLLRTAVYSLGVFIVLVVEKTFEGHRDHGGFGPSLVAVFERANVHHVFLNTLCLSLGLLGYNVLSLIRKRLGEGALYWLFLTPLGERPEYGNRIP